VRQQVAVAQVKVGEWRRPRPVGVLERGDQEVLQLSGERRRPGLAEGKRGPQASLRSDTPATLRGKPAGELPLARLQGFTGPFVAGYASVKAMDQLRGRARAMA
jgi:hypothetical protein